MSIRYLTEEDFARMEKTSYPIDCPLCALPIPDATVRSHHGLGLCSDLCGLCGGAGAHSNGFACPQCGGAGVERKAVSQ